MPKYLIAGLASLTLLAQAQLYTNNPIQSSPGLRGHHTFEYTLGNNDLVGTSSEIADTRTDETIRNYLDVSLEGKRMSRPTVRDHNRVKNTFSQYIGS